MTLKRKREKKDRGLEEPGQGKTVHIFQLWAGILCGGRRPRGGGRPGSQALGGAPKCGLKPG